MTLIARRRAGKVSVGALNAAGNASIGPETARDHPPLQAMFIGQGSGFTNVDSPIEFVGFRRGTFTDAELTTMLRFGLA